MPRTRVLAGAVLAGLLFSGAAAATQFSQVVVFGDSLSDSGNLSLASSLPWAPSRFTTNPGTTTAENVAAALGYTLSPSLAGGTDYAFGGAGLINGVAPVPTLPQQLQMYLAANGGKADPNALYQVWGGANDIFYLTGTSTDPNVLAGGTAAAAQAEVQMLGQLQAAGARYVVVYNLPDIGKTPASAAGGAAAQAGATQLSLVFNGVLNTGLGQLSNAEFRELNIIPVNAFALLNEVIADPAAYGFTNVTAPACSGPFQNGSSLGCGPAGSGLPNSYADGTNQTYLFADGVHPTAAAHAMMGQFVIAEIMAPAQMSLLAEAPLAAAEAQLRAVRNEMFAVGDSATRLYATVDYNRQHFDAIGGAPRTRSNNVDLTIGTDAGYSDYLTVGAAVGLGQHKADFSNGAGGYKLQDISGTAYAVARSGGVYLAGSASFGQSNFSDIQRRFALGTATRSEGAKADGSHLGAALEAGWMMRSGNLTTGPFARAEWQTIKVDGFTEDGGDSSAMWFGRQQRDALIETLGWRFQGQWQVGNGTLAPFAELGWHHDGKADPREVVAGSTGMQGSFALTGYVPDKTWVSADVGLSMQFSSNVTGWLGYSGRFSDNSQNDDSVNMGLKIGF